MDYIIHLLILVGIYLILAQAFNLNFGVGQLFNLAHVASYAVGAYTTALLATVPSAEFDLSFGLLFWREPAWTLFVLPSQWYVLPLLILIGLYVIVAQASGATPGKRGIFDPAVVILWAIGCYVMVLLSMISVISLPVPEAFASNLLPSATGLVCPLGWSFFPCIVSSMLLCGCFSLVIGAISLKLSQDYFAIGTLAFSSVVSALLINWKSLTRGVLGIPGIPRPDLFGADFYENRNFLILMFAAVLVVEFVLYLIFRSPYSRSLRAQAEFEHAALALGSNVRRVRNVSFFVASTFAGLAGAFFAYYINYIDPSSFSLTEMIFVLTIVVVGRPGSFWGCIAGTAFLVLLPEPLRFIDISPSILGPMRQMLYAAILFVVVFVNRERLFPVERTV